MKNLLSCATIFCLLWFISTSALGQIYTMGPEEFISWEEFIADYFDEITQDAETSDDKNWQQETLEQLEDLHAHPVNINTADKEDLLSIPFLKESQIDSLLSYRKQKHLFRSLGELQWIDDISYTTRCHLSLFAFAGDTITKTVSHKVRFLKGKHNVISRLDLPLYKREGDHRFTKSELAAHPNRYYLGNRYANTTRYRYRYKKDIAYGLTFQKDSGEPFAAHHNYPFDYNSFYLYYRSNSHKHAFWLGDYNINIGEGLLFGSSFFYGPLQLTENTVLRQNRIRPHTSSDEVNFFRGLAATFSIKKFWKLSCFLSYRKLDGSIDNDTLKSFKTDGMHRSLTEMNNRRTAGNLLAGARTSFQKPNWHIGVNFLWSHYSKTVYPKTYLYNKYYLRGKSISGMSLDYGWKSRHWSFSGETATDNFLHFSASNNIHYNINSNNSLLLQQRFFSTHFVTPFGKTIQHGGRVQNELGVLFGLALQPIDRLHLTTYIDYHFHPRATYRCDLPSKGLELLVLSKITASQRLSFTLRYKLKSDQQNIAKHKNKIQFVTSHRGRFAANYNLKTFFCNVAADLAVATQQTGYTSFGWMLSTRDRFKISKYIDIHFFISAFFSDDYSSRLYAYEPQLQYAASFPTFAYHGARFAGLMQWNFCKQGYAALRYGITKYFNRDEIGSGPQLIKSSAKNDLSMQLGWNF